MQIYTVHWLDVLRFGLLIESKNIENNRTTKILQQIVMRSKTNRSLESGKGLQPEPKSLCLGG